MRMCTRRKQQSTISIVKMTGSSPSAANASGAMISTRSIAAVAAVATALVVFFAVSSSRDISSPSLRNSARRALLGGLPDPKTIYIRDVPYERTVYAGLLQQQQQQATADAGEQAPPAPVSSLPPPQQVGPNPNVRLIPATPYDLHKFPYQTTTEEWTSPKSRCVNPQDVLDIRNAIKILFDVYNVRTFPRNGFLLGIVRHGGLLPIEQIDFDVGVIFEDLVPLINGVGEPGIKDPKVLPDFSVKLQETEDFWVNWKGNDPATGERYPYFGAMFRMFGGRYRMHALATYPYRDTGTYFYPRLDKEGFNHDVHMKDAMRYNDEGADYRMVDTDERMTEENFEDGKQLGNVFDTNFECFREVQFYFTTIYVPCDYDAILTSQYGENWRHIEKRGGRGGPRHPSSKVSAKDEEEIMANGPFPVCAGLWETLQRAQAEGDIANSFPV